MQDNFRRWLTKTIGKDEMKHLEQRATLRAQMIKGRHDCQMSQQDLADEISVAKSTIARIEAGKMSPTQQRYRKSRIRCRFLSLL
ncbi:hypothetical protein GCM10007063_31850 [Lentibacillus kapialis]|uniref:HTH cro/C1-type domain-containing protein n=1 Tax=Lentibacillus kapialis TaxID=340214 RepID=A0A917Q2B7_9BACI|nr:helix-turn-helix transcriptional regulator [Lentibacillus kapialis]GGK06914.1 hypothetical protein GCM10007063_31850 [Lentibacillus kapialis]